MPPRPLTAKENSFIDKLMSRMDLEQKIGQLWLITPGGAMLTGATVNSNVEELIGKGLAGGIFGMFDRENNRSKILEFQNQFINHSPQGIPGIIALDIIHGYMQNSTHNYPTGPIPLGYNFHVDRLYRMARDAAEQAAADGYNLTFSPVGDFRHDYRDGRISEGHGTSIHLSSLAVTNMVRGYQGSDPSAIDRLAANGKHLDGYGDGIDYTGRDVSAATRLRHLEIFKAMDDAGILSYMKAFNTNAGVPAHGDPELDQLMRKIWGSDAAIIADYDGVMQLVNHGLGNVNVISAISWKSGMGMAMADSTPLALQDAIKQGLISRETIDECCARMLRMKLRMGLFNVDSLDGVEPGEKVRIAAKEMRGDSEERLQAVIAKVPQFVQAAREDASAACILLKNSGSALPLKRGSSIALIGPLATDGLEKRNLPGTWSIGADRDATVSILQGMKNVMGPQTDIIYARGSNIEKDPAVIRRLNCHGETVSIDPRTPEEMIAEALEACEKSDSIVLVVGEACEHSGESATRSSIRVPKAQRKLMKAVFKEFSGKKPITVVAIGGRPLALGKEFRDADALIFSGHGGSEMGHGLADVLSGDTQFSGRLNFDMPFKDGPFLHFDDLPTGRPARNADLFWVDFAHEKKRNPGLVITKGAVLSHESFNFNDSYILDPKRPAAIPNRIVKVSAHLHKDGEEKRVVDTDIVEDCVTIVEGKYGNLHVAPNGTYSYVITAENPPENGVETFGFELDQPVIFQKFTRATLLDDPVTPLAPFGYGLALDAEFVYSPININKSVLHGDDDRLEVSCMVKNTGTRAAMDFPQLYITDCEEPTRSLPVKELKGFVEGGLLVQAGEEREVKFTVTPDMLTFITARSITDFEKKWNEGTFKVGIGPNSLQVKTVDVEWKKQPLAAPVVSTQPAGMTI